MPPAADRDRDHPDQPELAQAQLAQPAAWKLPAELYPSWANSSDDVEPQDIAQRIVSDCSVCASIVVCLAHHKRFSSKVRLLGLFGPWYPTMVLVGAIISPPPLRNTPGRFASTLPIRRKIPLQWKHETRESSDCLYSSMWLTGRLQIGISPLTV